MESNFQIVEKPDWVTWDDIKQCLFEAHAENRATGINMAHYQWPAEKIKESLGKRGVVLVALDGNKLVGTAAIGEEERPFWYVETKCAYACFDGVIPECSGKGVFHKLDKKREELAISRGCKTIVFDTNFDNTKRQSIALKNGYKYVRFFMANSRDHYSIVMAKWLNECPFSNRFIKKQFLISKLLTKLQFKNNGKERGQYITQICKKMRKRFLGH